jgi:hypothetical protein
VGKRKNGVEHGQISDEGRKVLAEFTDAEFARLRAKLVQ